MNQLLITGLCWAVLIVALVVGYSWLRVIDKRNNRR